MSLFASVVNRLLHNNPSVRAPFVSAVILAGGTGERMGKCLSAASTKQMLPLGGMPMIVRTILAFEESPLISEIIIAARKEEMIKYKLFAQTYGFQKVKAVVRGGDNRQESAFNSLRKLNTQCDYILIHDGARPFVSQQNIADTIKAAQKYNCACAACHAKDTVKISNPLDFVENTPKRATVWHALTPQVFKADIYRAAAYMAKKDGYEGTDDCTLAERLGFKIKLVDCGYRNIKITTPEDLKLAEQLLKENG